MCNRINYLLEVSFLVSIIRIAKLSILSIIRSRRLLFICEAYYYLYRKAVGFLFIYMKCYPTDSSVSFIF
nr:MAG TPA: hypothetical protein [Caudoviricetes sp.]